MISQTSPANQRQETPDLISEVLFTTPAKRSTSSRYVVAAGAVTAAFGLRYLVSDELIYRLPFIFFVPATLFAAWYGGLGPGIAALVSGLLLGDYFFLEPHNALGPLTAAGRMAISAYTITSLTGIVLLQLLHTTNRRLEQEIERLRQQWDGAQ